MMSNEELNELINNKDYIRFLESNINADINALRLKKFSDISFDIKFAILQIECKNRIKKKLPELYCNNLFLFPNVLSTEQCTAEVIAKFHSSLIDKNDSVLDMTAGLCVDTFYISQKAKCVTAVEISEDIATIAKFNMQNMSDNILVLNQDSLEYINDCSQKYNVIFIDPARRGNNNKRLFGLSDCHPNVIELIPNLKSLGNILYIKASPMIDISQSIKELNSNVTDVWIIGVNNDCKELLFKVDLTVNNIEEQPLIHTINFVGNNERQELTLKKSNELPYNVPSSQIKSNQYMYEPNSCIMKAGIYYSLSSKYNVSQIQQNSHLFISDNYIVDFPGRKFQIIEIIPFKNRELNSIKKKYPQMNVSVRNFKLSADELKNKLKVNDGGNIYTFGTTDADNNAVLIICNKV